MKKAMIFTAACLVAGVAGLAVSLPMAAQDALDIYNGLGGKSVQPAGPSGGRDQFAAG